MKTCLADHSSVAVRRRLLHLEERSPALRHGEELTLLRCFEDRRIPAAAAAAIAAADDGACALCRKGAGGCSRLGAAMPRAMYSFRYIFIKFTSLNFRAVSAGCGAGTVVIIGRSWPRLTHRTRGRGVAGHGAEARRCFTLHYTMSISLISDGDGKEAIRWYKRAAAHVTSHTSHVAYLSMDSPQRRLLTMQSALFFSNVPGV